MSGTAYEPFWVRLFLDGLELREDRAAARLAPHLPALSPFVVWSVSGVTCWAARTSGYRGAFFTYPPEHPTPALAMLNRRCEFFDRTLREAVHPASGPGVDQVVVLGAGWDTRAYGRLRDSKLRVFEVDTPPTQHVKIASLERAGIDASHVTFVETDFGQWSWLEALEEHGFDPALRSHVLWEGVTMYLEERAVRQTLASVQKLAPGSRLAFDYLSRELVEGLPPFRAVGKLLTANLKLYYGEAMHFGLETRPQTHDPLQELLEGAGLSIAEHDRYGAFPAPWGGVALLVKD